MDRITAAFLTSDERRTLEELDRIGGGSYLAWDECCTPRAEGFDENTWDSLNLSAEEHGADCEAVAEWQRAAEALARFEMDMKIKYAK